MTQELSFRPEGGIPEARVEKQSEIGQTIAWGFLAFLLAKLGKLAVFNVLLSIFPCAHRLEALQLSKQLFWLLILS